MLGIEQGIGKVVEREVKKARKGLEMMDWEVRISKGGSVVKRAF